MGYIVTPVETCNDEKLFGDFLNKYLYISGNGIDKVSWFYKNSLMPGEMFLLRKDDGTIVGTKGYGFREFIKNGRKLLGAISADISVHEKHRSLKPAMTLNKKSFEMLKKPVDFHYTVPNRNSDILFRRKNSGFSKVGQFQRYAKILDTKAAFEQKISNKALSSCMGTLCTPIWKSALWYKRGYSPNVREIYDVRNMDNIFINSHYLSGVNSVDYIKWRFFDNPFKKYRILCIENDDDVGMVVFFEKQNRAHISTMVYSGHNPNILKWMLCGVEKFCLDAGLTTIVISGILDEDHENVFRSLWYIKYTPTGNLWVSDELVNDDYLVFPGDVDAE